MYGQRKSRDIKILRDNKLQGTSGASWLPAEDNEQNKREEKNKIKQRE